MERQALSQIERKFSLIVACLVGLSAWVFFPDNGPQLIMVMQKFDRLVAPVFDLATFSAGSFFAVYVLALSRAEGFLGRIFKTKTFRIFNSYVANSIILSVVLAVASMWLIVDGPQSYQTTSQRWVICLWLGLAGAAFASALRVVTMFLIIVRSGSSSQLGKTRVQAP